jgi:hypothetical protein
MGLRTDYSDTNLEIDEALRVTYAVMKISGSWGWIAANVSGAYSYMREFHRYAAKSFKYVGMTHTAAKKCRDAMVKYFTRTYRASIWQGTKIDGGWEDEDMGTKLATEVTLTHDGGDSWSVHVRVNEDDVLYRLISTSEGTSPQSVFSEEVKRTYGSDGHGTADETEASA